MATARSLSAGLSLIVLTSCGGTESPTEPAPAPMETAPAAIETAAPAASQLELHKLDWGRIEISDLDVFSTAGDYAGIADTFTNTCWLVRHPGGDLLWDLGLPGMLVNEGAMEQGIFTVSLDQTLADQVEALGLSMTDIETVAISHSHFDHIGQVDQVKGSTWLVHQSEYDFMFPADNETPADNAAQFAPFADLDVAPFSGLHDVFGDGSVLIHETPGHTPGHTSLQVNLPGEGPIFLTGDLYHRTESRELRRVPQFNSDVQDSNGEPGAVTQASMAAFEAAVADVGGRVIIQHEPDDVDSLPAVLR